MQLCLSRVSGSHWQHTAAVGTVGRLCKAGLCMARWALGPQYGFEVQEEVLKSSREICMSIKKRSLPRRGLARQSPVPHPCRRGRPDHAAVVSQDPLSSYTPH